MHIIIRCSSLIKYYSLCTTFMFNKLLSEHYTVPGNLAWEKVLGSLLDLVIIRTCIKVLLHGSVRSDIGMSNILDRRSEQITVCCILLSWDGT